MIQTKFGRIKIDILLTYDFVNNATVITNNGELSTLVQHQLGKNQNWEQLNQHWSQYGWI